MVRFPHTLHYTSVTGGGNSYQDASGQWITPVGVSEEVTLPCRIRPYEMTGGILTDEDTEHTVVNYIAYVPRETSGLYEGLIVELVNHAGEVMAKAPIKKMFRGSMSHLKLWV